MSGLILLDRDGVLNQMIVHPEHGTVDSPLHPDQVKMIDGAPKALLELQRLGYRLCIVTNQPASATGKTTRKNLEDVHAKVLNLVQSEGAKIASSHICFHRAEDGCSCRKPKTGLLEEALLQNPSIPKSQVWIVGDGITDILAGQNLGVKTAFLGPKKTDHYLAFEDRELMPDFWGRHLEGFATFLKGKQP